MDSIEEEVKKQEVGYIRIDGGTKQEIRHENVSKFQNDPNIKVAILSITAMSVGITLTACSNVVFAEMCWTPAVMQQAEDRAHRIGQKDMVTCHYLYGEGTLDPRLYNKLETKHAIVSNILDGSQIRTVAINVNSNDGAYTTEKTIGSQNFIENNEMKTFTATTGVKSPISKLEIKKMQKQITV